jgi:hypothetical protein
MNDPAGAARAHDMILVAMATAEQDRAGALQAGAIAARARLAESTVRKHLPTMRGLVADGYYVGTWVLTADGRECAAAAHSRGVR